ncbi:MAG: hypothetical protein ACI4II_03475 [Acutalibacteraceae bacterium]
MLMKIIKASTAVICILLTVTVALRMPNTLFTYIDSKSQGTIETQDIEQAELDFLTEMSLFEKLSFKNITSEISLTNGAINNKASIINIFINFTIFYVCQYNLMEDNINCVPYLRSDNVHNYSFIVWSVDYINEYVTIHADIDDETGCVLSYSFYANFCDGEYVYCGKDAEGYEEIYNWQGYPYVSAYELAKYYADYLSDFIVDNTEELTDDTFPFIDIIDDSTANYDEIIVDGQEMEAETDYISSVLLIPRDHEETPIKIETYVGYISFNR